MASSIVPHHHAVELRVPRVDNPSVMARKRKRGLAEPDEIASSRRMRLVEIERLRMEADRMAQHRLWAKASAVYLQAIGLSGSWAERTLMASIHFNLVVCLIRQGKFEEAIPHAEEATKQEPSFTNAHFALGYALCLAGRDIAVAMRSFRMMMQLNPQVRIRLPSDGQLFGPKGRPTLAPSDVLTIFTRPVLPSELPPDWVCRESRSQPGNVFFENIVARKTSWNYPQAQPQTQELARTVAPGSYVASAPRFPQRQKTAKFLLQREKVYS